MDGISSLSIFDNNESSSQGNCSKLIARKLLNLHVRVELSEKSNTAFKFRLLI